MNPFKVGDRVRCTDTMSTWGPKRGEEFIVTCIDNDFIGFVSKYPLNFDDLVDDDSHLKFARKGKEAWWDCHAYELVSSAIKDDSGKPQLSLIPYESLVGEASALEYGAERYGKDNYKKGMSWSRLLNATLRHIYKFIDRKDIDDESKLNHLYHAKSNLGMLIYYYENKVGKDDR